MGRPPGVTAEGGNALGDSLSSGEPTHRSDHRTKNSSRFQSRGLQTLSVKRPENKYFRLCGPYGLCHNHSIGSTVMAQEAAWTIICKSTCKAAFQTESTKQPEGWIWPGAALRWHQLQSHAHCSTSAPEFYKSLQAKRAGGPVLRVPRKRAAVRTGLRFIEHVCQAPYHTTFHMW